MGVQKTVFLYTVSICSRAHRKHFNAYVNCNHNLEIKLKIQNFQIFSINETYRSFQMAQVLYQRAFINLNALLLFFLWNLVDYLANSVCFISNSSESLLLSCHEYV